MPHKPIDTAAGEYHLGRMYRELMKVEDAITEAEQREQRMADAGPSGDLKERFGTTVYRSGR